MLSPNINGEAYCGINKKLFTQAFQTLKRNPIKIQNDKTVIDFVLDSDNTRAKRENIELHTTITVVVVKTTPEELTAFVDALPDISSLVYSEHYTVVQSYNRAYRGYTDQEKARLSAETVKKLQDSVARMEVLKKQSRGWHSELDRPGKHLRRESHGEKLCPVL